VTAALVRLPPAAPPRAPVAATAPGRPSVAELSAAVAAAGFGASAVIAGAAAPPPRAERRERLRCATAAGLLVGQIGLATLATADGGRVAALVPLQLLLAFPVALWCALPLYRRALAGARHGRLGMEALLALGVLGAFGVSALEALRGGAHLYLETGTALVAAALGVRTIEGWLEGRALATRGGAEAVTVGAGGGAAADALRARLDAALAGTAPAVRLADRLAQALVPVALLVALAALVGHIAAGRGLAASALAAVAVLVAACPCAFGAAASAGLSLAIVRLARAGVFVREPGVLEHLARLEVAVFDKTGTLTAGDLALAGTAWVGPPRPALLGAVRALAERAEHPVAAALCRALPPGAPAAVTGVRELPGRGIVGAVDGQPVTVGRRELFAPGPLEEARPAPGATRVWFGAPGQPPAGLVDLTDRVRPEAADVVAALAVRGITSELLSGDATLVARRVAAQTYIGRARGDLRPDQKAAVVADHVAAGRRVMYVGDGTNDGEALAAATCGVAICSGARAAAQAAAVVVTRPDLGAVLELVDMARRAGRMLRGSFVWALVSTLGLLPLAAFGQLRPIHAAALMVVSTASVALSSMGLRRRG
jgi:cation transport ATPase